ncbi:MAG TPA: hypothetical protein VN694_06500 [Caulobacteraceae bacterium]|nr:hypothetical protein [Caulobacteraceae bacterium]
MVDPKDTNERTVETGAGLEQAARKAWMKPRLETFSVTEETRNGLGNTTLDGAGGGSIS